MTNKKYLSIVAVLTLVAGLITYNWPKTQSSFLNMTDKNSQLITGLLQNQSRTFIISTSGDEHGKNGDLNLYIKNSDNEFEKVELIKNNSLLLLANGQCIDPAGKRIYLAWAEKSEANSDVFTVIGLYDLEKKEFSVIKKIQVQKAVIYPSSVLCNNQELRIASYISDEKKSTAQIWNLNLSTLDLKLIHSDLLSKLGSHSIISQMYIDQGQNIWIIGSAKFKETDSHHGFILKEEAGHQTAVVQKILNYTDDQLPSSIFQDAQKNIFLTSSRKLSDSNIEYLVQKIVADKAEFVFKKTFQGLGLLSSSMIDYNNNLYSVFTIYNTGGYSWFTKNLSTSSPENLIEYGKAKSCHGSYLAVEDNKINNYGSCIVGSGQWRVISQPVKL